MSDEEDNIKYSVRFVFKEKAFDGVYSITLNFLSATDFQRQWREQIQTKAENGYGFVKFELAGKQMNGWHEMLGIPLNNIAYFEHLAG